jgi:hypothetical protein
MNELEQLVFDNVNMPITVSHLSDSERWDEADAIIEQVEPLGYPLNTVDDLKLYYRLFLLIHRYPQDSSPENYKDFIEYYFSEYSHLFDANVDRYYIDEQGKICYGGFAWRYVGEWKKTHFQALLDELADCLKDF